MVQHALNQSSKLGSLVADSPEGDSTTDVTAPHPDGFQYGGIVMTVEGRNATEYVTSLVISAFPLADTPGCSPDISVLGINLAILPALLRQLPFLEYSSCRHCCGSAPMQQKLLPSVLPKAAPRLRVLYLHGSGVVGSIPQAWGRREGLQDLDLSDNALSGSLPSNMAGRKSSFSLDVSNNKLTGTLPEAYGMHISEPIGLTFNVMATMIQGSIPLSWSNLPTCTIYADPSQLRGCLPDNVDIICCYNDKAWDFMKYDAAKAAPMSAHGLSLPL
jgi:hypothetical protein